MCTSARRTYQIICICISFHAVYDIRANFTQLLPVQQRGALSWHTYHADLCIYMYTVRWCVLLRVSMCHPHPAWWSIEHFKADYQPRHWQRRARERARKTDAELIPFYPVRHLQHNLRITYVVVSILEERYRSDALEVDIRNSHGMHAEFSGLFSTLYMGFSSTMGCYHVMVFVIYLARTNHSIISKIKVYAQLAEWWTCRIKILYFIYTSISTNMDVFVKYVFKLWFFYFCDISKSGIFTKLF